MKKKMLSIALLSMLILLTVFAQVEAQEPDQPEELDPVQSSGGPAFDLSWPDLLFEEENLGPGDDSEGFEIYVPGDVIPAQTGSYVDLVFSHTTPQTDTQADLTVSFNGSLLQVIPLTSENSNRARLRFALPGDLWQPGRNRLWVDLNVGLACGVLPANRVTAVVYPESLLHLEYNLASLEPDLSFYPAPFYERTFAPNPVYLILPEDPTVTDISTAASISAGLGVYSEGRARIVSVTPGELTDEIRQNNHLIVIGQPEANTLLSQLQLPLPLDSSLIEDDSGVLQELVSPWNSNKKILVVAGRSEEGLSKAGDVLNRDLNFLGMKGPIAIVEEVLPPSEAPSQREIDVTFDMLEYDDATFYGARLHEDRFFFSMPLSWEMAEPARLYLSFNHSTAIDPEISTLSVELNGVPLGSVSLNAENAINGILEVELPDWLLEPGRNRLDVRVAMVMGADPCADINNPQAWTVIRRDSYIHLPYVEQEADFDLSLFSYPFTENANLTSVSLVLPDFLSQPVRDRLFQLAVLLGDQANGDRITLRAVAAENIDEVKDSNHLIVVGRPTNNSLIRELNEQLPQPFKDNSDQLAPRLDSAVLVETSPRSAGLLQELASPSNPELTILVVTGTTDEGVAAAFDWLLDDLPEEIEYVDLEGDLAVIEDGRLYSTDTRLLKGQLPAREEARVAPVSRPGAAPKEGLVDRWW